MATATKRRDDAENDTTLDDQRMLMEKNMVTYLIRSIRIMQLFWCTHAVAHALLDQNIREQLQKKRDLDEEYKELFGHYYNYPTLDELMARINKQKQTRS